MKFQNAAVQASFPSKPRGADAPPAAPGFFEENLMAMLLFSAVVLPVVGFISTAMYLSNRAAGIAP